jgi:DNA-binding phage protein
MRDRNHDEAMAELLREDPAYALELLNEILEDGELGELLIALRQMTKAFGGVQSVAEKANLNPTQLIRSRQPGAAQPFGDSQSNGFALGRRAGAGGIRPGLMATYFA